MKTGRKLLATILSKIKNCATVAGQPRGTPAQFFFQNSPFEIFQPKLLRDCGPRAPARALSFFRLRSLDNFSKIGRDFPRKNLAKRSFLFGRRLDIFVDFQTFS